MEAPSSFELESDFFCLELFGVVGTSHLQEFNQNQNKTAGEPDSEPEKHIGIGTQIPWTWLLCMHRQSCHHIPKKNQKIW
jgi:hypothetical protein